MLLLSSIGSGDVEGPAPNDTYAVRRAWGKKNLKHFDEVDLWIRCSDEIEEDIGKVKGVAPIDGPNRYSEAFGEDSTDMNLQVIGQRGKGTLRLDDLTYWGTSAEDWRLRGLDLEHWLYTLNEDSKAGDSADSEWANNGHGPSPSGMND